MRAGLIVVGTAMSLASFGSTVRIQFTSTPTGSIHVLVSAAPSASLFDWGRSRRLADAIQARWRELSEPK